MNKFALMGISGATIASAALLAIPSVAQAATFAAPSGLSAGDQFRLVFVTSEGREADIRTIDAYNTFVDDAAANSSELNAFLTGLGFANPSAVDWTAIASSGDPSNFNDDLSALENTNTDPDLETGVSIFRLDGVKVADDNADFWDGSLDNPMNLTETGETVLADEAVWTGIFADGFPDSSLGSLFATFGQAGATDSEWANFSGSNFVAPFRFYAMSEVLTLPQVAEPVPEPASMLGLLAVGAVAAGSTLKRKRSAEA